VAAARTEQLAVDASSARQQGASPSAILLACTQLAFDQESLDARVWVG